MTHVEMKREKSFPVFKLFRLVFLARIMPKENNRYLSSSSYVQAHQDDKIARILSVRDKMWKSLCACFAFALPHLVMKRKTTRGEVFNWFHQKGDKMGSVNQYGVKAACFRQEIFFDNLSGGEASNDTICLKTSLSHYSEHLKISNYVHRSVRHGDRIFHSLFSG